MEPIIKSILDTDLYKITMQEAVLFGRGMGIAYESVGVKYQFINRGGTKFPTGFKEALQEQINHMANLTLTDDEYRWLRRKCKFLKRSYLDYLRGYQFDPSEVHLAFEGGVLNIEIRGPWHRTILWEVPLMAIISELYFKLACLEPDDEWHQRIQDKADFFSEHHIPVADFGTRRRFSFDVQNILVWTMKQTCRYFVGTSNVYLAYKHDVRPIGTHAHEWFQVHAALFGYRLANQHALEAWEEEYQGDLGIALTDTFTTSVFFDAFGMRFAKLFDGVRHDSGDPIQFADRVVAHYRSLHIDPMSKTIIFSDGLNPQEAKRIKDYCNGKIKCSFGIGTNLSNDCGHKPLNMVIKVVGVQYNGHQMNTVKLSDVAGKETGDPGEIAICKAIYGLSQAKSEEVNNATETQENS